MDWKQDLDFIRRYAKFSNLGQQVHEQGFNDALKRISERIACSEIDFETRNVIHNPADTSQNVEHENG